MDARPQSALSGTRSLPGNLSGFAGRFVALPKPALAAALMLLIVALAGIIWLIAAGSDQRQLYPALDDADRAAVTAALDSAGIGYAIDPGSGALKVDTQDYHQARMRLAAEGLPRSAPTGADLIAELPMGSSRAVEGQRLRAARELDLARTIEAIDAVAHARVMLAEADRSPFAVRSSDPSASVMLELAAGRSLSEEQVEAIVHLVASSTQGLAADRVSVVDQRGTLLSRRRTGSDARLAAKIAMEQRYREAIAAVLTPMLGEENFSAEVSVDLDFAEVQSSEESVPAGPAPLRSEQGATTIESATAAAGGIPGVLANQPAPDAQLTTVPPAAAPAAGGTEQLRNQNFTRDFVVPRSVAITRREGPNVARLSVAVAVRAPARASGRQARLDDIERLVSAAVGADPRRGDVVAVAERPFVAVDAATMPVWEQPVVRDAARWLAVLAAACAIFFLVIRPLMRWIMAAQKQESGGPDAFAPAPAPDRLTDLPDPTGLPVAALRDFAQHRPEQTAQLVRALIRQPGVTSRG